MLLSMSGASSVTRKKTQLLFLRYVYTKEFYLCQTVTKRFLLFVNIILTAINYFKQLALFTLFHVSFVFPKPNVTRLLLARCGETNWIEKKNKSSCLTAFKTTHH